MAGLRLCKDGKTVYTTVFGDFDAAFDSIVEDMEVQKNNDGTLRIEIYGNVLFENYKPDFDVEKYSDPISLNANLLDELIRKGLVELRE
ncbi:hypothetical protein [Thermococcus sp.]|uniref:hypothetical protein n=1 Tax=Thermococcus sp. TaxID=35749 RepID=UPI00261977A4|nr:hypothetical protein [Thermococcus sp.]